MKRFSAFLLAVWMTVMLAAPALALDRVNWYYSLQPPSTWLSQQEKNEEYEIGQLIWDFIGRSNTSGFFTNLSVVPATTPMYVQVQPTTLGQLGSLYQIGPADVNPFGGTGGGGPTAPSGDQLPADATQLFQHGQLSGPTAFIGPFVAPTTTGYSVIDLVECKTQIVDQNNQAVNYVSSLNVASSGTAPRDRVTTIVCQQKAGTAALSPVAPSVDSGWVQVGSITILANATTISSGDITPATQFNGFLPAGTVTSLMDLVNNQTANGNKTFNGITAFNNMVEFTNAAVTIPNLPAIMSDWQTNPGLLFNVASGSAGFGFYVNGTKKSAIDANGNYTSGSSSYGSTMNVSGGTFDGTTLTANSTSGYLTLNAQNTTHGVRINYNNSSSIGTKVYDGGTANYSNLTATGLSFSGTSTSAYTNADATVYGNLTMPNQSAGECAQFDASHHLTSAGGPCGLASGTLTSVTSLNTNLSAVTSSGAVALDFLHAPKFNSTFVGTPDAATGYNVYVGTSSGAETLQNATPISIGANWNESMSGLVGGASLPTRDAAGFQSTAPSPVLGSVAGGSLGAATYYVKITYVNKSGESVFASPEVSLAVAANNLLTVDSPVAYTPATSLAAIVFGDDQQESLQRSGSAFVFGPWLSGGTSPTVEADGGFISGSSSYYPTYATINGNLSASEGIFSQNLIGHAANSRPLLSDNGTNAATFGTSYFAAFGGVNAQSNILAYPCLANSSHACLLISGGDVVSGVTASAFEVGISAVSGLLGLDGSGNLGAKGNFQTGSSVYGATSATINGPAVLAGTAGGTASQAWLGGITGSSLQLNVPPSQKVYFSVNGTYVSNVASDGTYSVGSSTYGPTSATVNGSANVKGNLSIPDGTAASTLLLGNTGTATSGGSFASSTLQFDDSYWNGSAAVTNHWTLQGNNANNLNLSYNGSLVAQFLGATSNLSLASGSLTAGSSTYGPTSATVNGNLTLNGASGSLSFSGTGAGTVTASNGYLNLVGSNATNGGVVLSNSGNTNAIAYFQQSGTNESYIGGDGSLNIGSSLYGGTSATVNGLLTSTGLSSGTTVAEGVSGTAGGSTDAYRWGVTTANCSGGWGSLVASTGTIAGVTDNLAFLGCAGNGKGIAVDNNGNLGVANTAYFNNGFISYNAAASLNAGGDGVANSGNFYLEVGNAAYSGNGTSLHLTGRSGANLTTINLAATSTVTSGYLCASACSSSIAAGDITAARSSTTGVLYMGTGGTTYLYYNGSGYILNSGTGLTATAFFNASKREWKHDISRIDGWDVFSMLPNMYKYHYNKGHGDDGKQWRLGYMADGPDGAVALLSGPHHDHEDVLNLAALDTVAVKQLNERVKKLEQRGPLGVVVNGTTHDPRVDQLQREVQEQWYFLLTLAVIVALLGAAVVGLAVRK